MASYRRGGVSPAFYDYIQRAKAEMLRKNAEFLERKRCAIAKQAVEEQGVGE